MYSKQYLDKPETFWNQVKWTDEVKMKLIGNNHQRYVWRKKKNKEKCVTNRLKKKKGKRPNWLQKALASCDIECANHYATAHPINMITFASFVWLRAWTGTIFKIQCLFLLALSAVNIFVH